MRVRIGSRQIAQYPNNLSRSIRAAMTDVLREITQASLGRIRKTSETPPHVSIYDVIGAITGKNSDDSGKAYRRLVEQFPEVRTAGSDS